MIINMTAFCHIGFAKFDTLSRARSWNQNLHLRTNFIEIGRLVQSSVVHWVKIKENLNIFTQVEVKSTL